jgi:hypothetical protein
MQTIEFDEASRMRRIGELAFMGCRLRSITIPSLTEEIDGSAFLHCPLTEIRVSPGNVHFKIDGNLLMTSDGTQIVRYFGQNRKIVIGKNIKVFGKSCFECCKLLDRIDFEIGSELERIGPAALRDCESLIDIDIPPSVEVIDESSFEGCIELETCLFGEYSSLVTIGCRAFAKCTSLRSFSIPRQVVEIGGNCFAECLHLYRFGFWSSKSLKRVIGDKSLDAALDGFGVSGSSGLFRIEIEDGAMDFIFTGWVYVHDDCEEDETDLQLSLVRDLP